ncbi:MAG TPA: hypothetical protein VMT18_05725 [Planctomycetota bacterium]|nr:hypothetical protein [Planctomycetota bacterium]
MQRALVSFALFCTALPLCAALLASRPAALGGGAVVDAHRALFACLDRGDADAAAKFFTTSKAGMSVDRAGGYGDAPGSLFFVPGGAEDPARAMAERFAGGTTRIVRGWSDCPNKELSWAALELEHSPREGAPQRWHSTGLVSFGKEGVRLWFWHLSPVAADAAAKRTAAR